MLRKAISRSIIGIVFYVALLIPVLQVGAESVNVMLQVAVCNANLICEDVIGENYTACPSDCEAPPMPTSTPTTTPSETPTNFGGGQTGGGFGGVFSNSGATNSNINVPGTLDQGSTLVSEGSSTTLKPRAIIPPAGIVGSIRINPSSNSTTLNFRTSLASLATIKWGSTATYEMGSMADSWYYQSFSKKISNLNPGTRYYYQIDMIDSIGRRSSYEGSFVTAEEDYKAKLPAVTGFQMASTDIAGLATIRWDVYSVLHTYPAGSKELDGFYVKILRSEFGYPADPTDGKVVYKGKEEQFTDTGLSIGKSYYYSALAMNKYGDFSSPAILFFTMGSSRDVLLQDGQGVTNIDTHVTNLDKSPAEQVISCHLARTAEASASGGVLFIQDKRVVPVSNQARILNPSDPFMLKLSSLVSDAKNVSLRLFSPLDNQWSDYLLSKNKDGSYGIVLPAFSENFSGKKHYEFVVNMVKYNGEKMILESGDLIFNYPETVKEKEAVVPITIVTITTVVLAIIRRFILWIF